MSVASCHARLVAFAVSLCMGAALAADAQNWLTLERVGTAKPETLAVARDLPDQPARERLPVLIEVRWAYKALANGMPTEDELALGKRLDAGLDGIFGARGMRVVTRTGDGGRTMYFHVDDAERHAGAIKRFFDSLPAVSVQVRARDEPDWETVREIRAAIK